MGESERKIGGGGVNGRGGKRKRWRKGNRCNGCLAYYFFFASLSVVAMSTRLLSVSTSS